MNKIYLTWQDIISKIEKSGIDVPGNKVYGVPKGGMILTAFLENAKAVYDITEADWILDDIIDSGLTAGYYANNYPEIPFYYLYDKNQEFKKEDWIVFPWESEHPGEKEDNIQDNIVRQLQYLGEDPFREGLIGTPGRVVRMWGEIFRGYHEKNRPNITTFPNGEDGVYYDQMIIDTGDFHSHCEHHMVPFFGNYWFGYIPASNGFVLGLSKVARIVDYHAAKLQIQERLVHEIVEDLWNALDVMETTPIGMGLVMKGEHLCKTMRGAKKKGIMTTIKLKGKFLSDPAVKAEFLNMVK